MRTIRIMATPQRFVDWTGVTDVPAIPAGMFLRDTCVTNPLVSYVKLVTPPVGDVMLDNFEPAA